MMIEIRIEKKLERVFKFKFKNMILILDFHSLSLNIKQIKLSKLSNLKIKLKINQYYLI